MRYSSEYTTETGIRRSTSQDVVRTDKELGVYIVCDGIGSSSGGEIAAKIAAETCLEYLKGCAATIRKIADNQLASSQELTDLAQSAIESANTAVHSHTQKVAELGGSGTTIALLLTAGDHGVCAHVGDSRIFALRNGKFFQLTKDHSLTQDLIDRGLIDNQKAGNFAFKHVLSRAVGLLPAVSADTLHFDILPGDRFLLASDGVPTEVAGKALEDASIDLNPKAVLETIKTLARKCGSEDDLSAIIVEVAADESEIAIHAARSEELGLKTSVLQDVFLFRTLDPQHILRIVDASDLVDCQSGDALVVQGEPEDSLYVILEGTFDVEINGEKIAQLGKGNHFGEMALLTRNPRSATVRAASKGKLLKLTVDKFNRFVQTHPQDGLRMMVALAQELSERLRRSNQSSQV